MPLRTADRDAATLLLKVKVDAAEGQRILQSFYAFEKTEMAKAATAKEAESNRVKKAAQDVIRETEKESKALTAARQAAEREYDKMAKAAEKSANDAIKAYRKIEQETRRPSAFQQAVLSSRFSLPGTGGNVMPLVGQTLRGGAGVVAGAGIVAGGAALSAAAVRGVDQAGSLQQDLEMLRAQAHATDDQLKELRQTARDLGADTQLPATSSLDAANAMLELSKKGQDVDAVMKGARGALLLAAAAETDAGKAAGFAAGQVNAFGLQASDTTKVADLFTKAMLVSGSTFDELQAAFRQGAAVYHQAGFSIEELSLDIAAMTKAGIKGEDAGTSLKTAVLALISPSKEARDVMQKLGIEVYDSSGKLKNHAQIVQELRRGLEGLTQQQQNAILKILFGTDAIRAANIVWTTSVEKQNALAQAFGGAASASDLAHARMQGYKGAVEGLHSATDSFLEEAAAPFLNFLTAVINKASDAAQAISDMRKEAARGQYVDSVESGGKKQPGQLSTKQQLEAIKAQRKQLGDEMKSAPGAISYGSNGVLSAPIPAGTATLFLGRLAQEQIRLEKQLRLEEELDAEERRKQSTLAREQSQAEREQAETTAKRRRAAAAGILAGKQKKPKKDTGAARAAAEAKKRNEDTTLAGEKSSQTLLDQYEYTFNELLDRFNKTDNPIEAALMPSILQGVARTIEHQQRVMAQSAKEHDVAQDPEHTKTAGATFRQNLVKAAQDRQKRLDRIQEAIEQAQKKQAEEETKKAEIAVKQHKADQERYDKSAESYQKFLQAEGEGLQQQLDQAKNLQEANRLIEQITDNRAKQAGLTMQRGIVEAARSQDFVGIETALMQFVVTATALQQQQYQLMDEMGQRFAIDLTRYPTSSDADYYSPDRKHSEYREVGRNIEATLQNSLTDLFNGRGGGSRSLLSNLFATARNDAASHLVHDIGRDLTSKETKEVFKHFTDSLEKNTKGLDLSAKSLLTAAVMINGALSLLGANGGKKQRNSIFGALAGVAIGSLIPGGALWKDALFGAGIGGILPFAEGGEPPVGRMSWVGERGPELWIPKEPGNILNGKQLAAVGRSVGAGRHTQINIGAVYEGADIEHLARRLDDHRDRQSGFPGD